MFVCVLINIYGVRFATMVNNIGVSLELVITVGATALVAIIAFSAPENHQPISVLFTGGEAGDKDSYMLAWLAAALGPFFGLIGVESGADVAEETKNARRVVPKHDVLRAGRLDRHRAADVHRLRAGDQGRRCRGGQLASAPIEEIITQQAGPVVTKIVVAVALTNILACLLANILVATRLTYSMARDNMLPFSHIWRHVSPTRKTPTYAILGLGAPVDAAAAVRAGQREGVQLHPRHRVAAVLLRLHPADHRPAGRLPQGHHPGGRARHLRPRPLAAADLRHRAGRCSSASPSRCCSCRSSPATSGCSSASSPIAAIWWATGLQARLRPRRGRRRLRQDPLRS